MNNNEISSLIRELLRMNNETEWLEFKHNKVVPDEIGQNISALSNSAALMGKACAYIVWGIEDQTQRLVGTTFNPRKKKVGNEELENWLQNKLVPRIDFRFYDEEVDEQPVVLLEIPAATSYPVRFAGESYIRVGSYTKKLRDFLDKERALFKQFDQTTFEENIAMRGRTSEEILKLIDYQKYFQLMKLPVPEESSGIIQKMISENLLKVGTDGRYDITNVGAILFARDLNDFERLARKAPRIIFYKDSSRVETIKEQSERKGYAVGFESMIRYISDQLPQNEQVVQALRQEVRMYPEIAIRELVANALIHQDFNVSGAGPMIEIFSDRLEITNPGLPLIDPLRFIDEPPRSRNEILAALMRRMAICEERGSGIDKVIFQVEVFQLPAPDFRTAGSSTVAVLYGARKFAQMRREERIRACYQHACLQYVSGKRMSNASLRQRLGIKGSSPNRVGKLRPVFT